MSNDEEYREVIRRFYEVYRPLQKRHNLRLHSHFSIYDDGLTYRDMGVQGRAAQ